MQGAIISFSGHKQPRPGCRFFLSRSPNMRLTVDCGTPTVLALAAGFKPARKEARIRLALPSGTSRPSSRSATAMVAGFDAFPFATVGVASTGEGFGNAADFLRSVSKRSATSFVPIVFTAWPIAPNRKPGACSERHRQSRIAWGARLTRCVRRLVDPFRSSAGLVALSCQPCH